MGPNTSKNTLLNKVSRGVNNLIGVFSPTWALKRINSALALDDVRGYLGAKQRKREAWTALSGDADTAIIPHLATMRDRSRDLIRNNPWATSVIDAIIQNVLGPNGITLEIKNKKKSLSLKDLEEFLQNKLNNLDLTSFSNWQSLQYISFYRVLEDGECFIRKVVHKGQYKLQLLEADQVYSTQSFTKNGNEIIEGIEIDKVTGKHVAYYINTHPGKFGFIGIDDERRVPHDEIIHIFLRKRPGQTRGVPILSSVLRTLFDLQEYLEAEIVGARIAACLGLVIKTNTPPGREKELDKPIRSIFPGMIGEISAGEDIKVIDPSKPGKQFDPFTRTVLRAVAAATGISYETLTRDYSQANFSSIRQGCLAERPRFKFWQKFIIDNLNDPVVFDCVNFAILKGQLPASIIPEKIKRKWKVPGFEWIDPLKEVNAYEKALELKIDSKQRITAEKGLVYEDIVEEIAEEQEFEKKFFEIEDTQKDAENAADIKK